MPRRSSFFPLNENADVLAATRKSGSWASALMISSAIPSLKYSFSGSVLMFANGNTAMDFGASVPHVEAAVVASESRKRAIDAGRCAGSRAIAVKTAASTCRCTPLRFVVTRGGCRVNRWTRIDSNVGPVNGGSPVSIS